MLNTFKEEPGSITYHSIVVGPTVSTYALRFDPLLFGLDSGALSLPPNNCPETAMSNGNILASVRPCCAIEIREFTMTGELLSEWRAVDKGYSKKHHLIDVKVLHENLLVLVTESFVRKGTEL